MKKQIPSIETTPSDRALEKKAVLDGGGVDLNPISDIAGTSVDFIPVGALTHSAPALDIGLGFMAGGMKKVMVFCALALYLGCAIWITQSDKKYPLTKVICSLIEYKDHNNRLYLYGSSSGFSKRPNLIGDFLSHLLPSAWKPPDSGLYFNQIQFVVGEDMMEIYVFHFNDVIDLVEINVNEKTAIAGDRLKKMLLDQFPDIPCRIVRH